MFKHIMLPTSRSQCVYHSIIMRLLFKIFNEASHMIISDKYIQPIKIKKKRDYKINFLYIIYVTFMAASLLQLL